MANRIVTIASSGGDYTTFPLALAGESDFQAGEDDIIFRRTDNVRESSGVTVSGFTTTTAHRVILECSRSVQHDGTRASGAGIVASVGFGAVFQVDISNVIIRYLEIKNSSTASARGVMSNYNVVVDSCLIYDSITGIYNNGNNAIIVNNLIYNCDDGLWGSYQHYAYNNTILNSNNRGYYTSTFDNRYSKNNYIGGSTSADISKSYGTLYLTTTYTSDGSESTSVVSLANCEFTSSTDGSEDANIGSGSDLIGAGTSLASDSVYPVTVDCFGNTRGATPCIGAVEYTAASSGGSSNSYYYQQQQM